ncbi:RNA polymerase II subunit A C-terminal domain phosphatase isoform X2 [Aethina tumida]|nr:RNA polymerase II subunit A C-terminal domain phosphatase isoform X2 [Aethina tumida]
MDKNKIHAWPKSTTHRVDQSKHSRSERMQCNMAAETVCITLQQTKPIKILKWKVRRNQTIPMGRVILLYDFDGAEKPEQRKLKSSKAGTVRKILIQEGVIVQPGETLLELAACCHPTIMNDMCGECGADLRKADIGATASVPMVHAIPDLKVSEELAQKIGKADNERLIKERKLVLLVDLDQTLIHTTNDNIPPNIKDVYHFQLYGPNSVWYHTRFRPGTMKFLKTISEFFELHICTFGARNYAHMIALFLDKDQTFFSNRILSRDECFDPTSKKANLKALFPCGDNMVCIIDDREDVWSHASNLIHVKPYHFFQHTGDINAPPGLDKHENDVKPRGVELHKPMIKVRSKNEAKKDAKKETMLNGCIEQTKKHSSDANKDVNGVVNNEDSKTKSSDDKKEADIEKSDVQETTEQNTDVKKAEKEAANVEPKEEDDNKKVTEKPDTEIVDKSTKETEKSENECDEAVESGDSECVKEKKVAKKEDDLIELEDPDDYLIYLEDVLKRIHTAFYEEFDKLESGDVPDLKKVIPRVRNKVLKGTKLVFSGLVPTHIKLEQSKAYQVARSLGAEVSQDLDNNTTHLVAVRPGTAKVNAGKRKKKLKIVTPDWLWCCAERWEHVDERNFPLNNKGSKNRHPPPHCSSPEHIPNYPEHNTPGTRKRTASGRFMDSINPLMTFSKDDIADMGKEV